MSQKIPLGQGMLLPAPNDAAGIFVKLFSPLDKNLKPEGIQDFYELHAWCIAGGAPAGEYRVVAVEEGGDPAADGVVLFGGTAALQEQALTNRRPFKVLDGYPVRGNVDIYVNSKTMSSTDDPDQYFGYYYRTGRGEVHEAQRRFIGPVTAGSFALGVPFNIADGASEVVHSFEAGRIDELALAIMPSPGDSGEATLTFEDSSDVIITGTSATKLGAIELPNWKHSPVGPYILQGAFGGGNAPETLDHLRIAMSGNASPVAVHGYFTRR